MDLAAQSFGSSTFPVEVPVRMFPACKFPLAGIRFPYFGDQKMRISNRFEKHIVAAAAVAMGAAAAANAGVVYSGIVNFACAADIDGCYINVQTNQLSNGPGSGVPGWDVNPYRSPTGSGMNFFSPTGGGMVSAVANTGPAINLAVGTVVGSTSIFSTATATISFGSAAGQWQYASDNIVGFRFVSSAGTTHYGWMRFLMGAAGSAGTSMTRTVVDYAYESTAGESITVTPAPGALALLGVAGLAGSRRRRN
jgi:MYXO-CTERM domain-containing protein